MNRTFFGKRVPRRLFLRGVGGVTLALPILEGLRSRRADAQAETTPSYAIFFRQADGVASAQVAQELGQEPERFWPREPGALDAANVEGRALDELTEFLPKLLVVGNANMEDFNFGDGHARGALQLLTGWGPHVAGAGGDSEAGGESLDHRIARELNRDGIESLYLYAGGRGGWLGGPCISHRGRNSRRTAEPSPLVAYQTMVGLSGSPDSETIAMIRARNKSVNDLVREELQDLLAMSDLSQGDRQRLDLHLSSIRDLEVNAGCRTTAEIEAELADTKTSSTDGDVVQKLARLHMDVAALAVACGYTRSVAIQVGDGNDGQTRYWVDGSLLENYHFISHRRLSHDASGAIIEGSDLLHHKIDRQFGQSFKHLLSRLSAYEFEDGTLLDKGLSCWMNDLGNGPGHSPSNCPVVIAGSAGGVLKNGEYVVLEGGRRARTHVRVLNTIATAVGCRTGDQDYCDDVGDTRFEDRSPLPELFA